MTDRALTDAEVERLFDRLTPDWRVVDATLADSGHHAVYHVTAATPTGRREVVLKTMPATGGYGVAVEARLQALLAEHTDIPVPAVHAAVDAAAAVDAPTPAYLMTRLDGRPLRRDDLSDLGETTVRTLARQLGGHLAELHAVDAVDEFGRLEPGRPTLDGDRPPADPASVCVADGTPSWADTLDGWVADATADLADGRFGDLTADVRPVLRARTEAVPEPAGPVLAHVDASLENHLWDGDGGLTGVLDWGFTLAATPAYDLACVAHSLGGGHWAFLPATPDHRETVHEPLLSGYRAGAADTPGAPAADRVTERFHAHWDCYGLLSAVRTAALFDWYEQRGVGTQRREAAAERLRATIRDWL